MCGIAGIIAGPGRAVDTKELARLSAAIAHRGPDGRGAAAWSPDSETAHANDCERLRGGMKVGLAHRRLSIIDTSDGGHQPMATPDGRFVLITNGEIYNYLELRRELADQGVVFRSQSDTEVLLFALARWGVERTLPKLVGMYAFAFLDTQACKLWLARDPFGIKPLLWAMRGGDLAFASEHTALLELEGLKRTANPQAVFDYLRFALTDHGANTLFDGIHHLPPGSWAAVDLRRPAPPEPVKAWLPSTKPGPDITFDEAAKELGRLFRQSIDLHLRADVPVGAALSGGIDSSAVVAAMRESAGERLKLHTFSFIAPGDRHDEERWADMAGQAVNATMHKTSLTSTALIEGLDDLIRVQGEPFGSTSMFAQNRVYALVRSQGIKVTLDGQGADEVLGGYTPFLAARLASLLREGRLGEAGRFLYAVRDQASIGGLLARSSRYILPPVLQRIARRLIGEDLMPGRLNGEWFRTQGVLARAPQQPKRGRVLMDEMAESLEVRVLPALLRHQDRNSMSYAVESRVPFLTPELVDFLYSLPESYLIAPNGETKSVFRAAMKGLVPDAILGRRDKIGFVTPQDQWLREAGDWLTGLIGGDRARSIPAIAQDVLRGETERLIRSGGKMPQHIWCAANLIRWADIFDVEFTR